MIGDAATNVLDESPALDETPLRRPGRVPVWRNGFGDLTDVIRSALRLLWRHWPVLVVLSFAGMAARGIATYAAVHVSGHNSVAGLLVFMFVPLVTLAALTLMLRVLRESLPSVSGDAAPVRSLDAIGSVLIPFLAVYASYGYLQADKSTYYGDTWNADQFSTSRIPTKLTVLLIVVVVVAVGARALLGRWTWAREHRWMGIIRAYLEIVWIATLAGVIEPLREAAWSWLNDRRIVHGTFTRLDELGQAGQHVHGALDWVAGLLGSAEAVIATPVAWLAVGAVIYGREIATGRRAHNRALARAVSRRWVRLPKLGQRIIAAIRDSLDERFGDLLDGLRVIFRAGLVSMLAFCLLFVVAQTAGAWMFMVERSILGPHDVFTFWMPVSDPLSVFNDGISWVLLICLLGAATDRVLRASAGTTPTSTATPPIAEAPPTVESPIPAQREDERVPVAIE